MLFPLFDKSQYMRSVPEVLLVLKTSAGVSLDMRCLKYWS